MHAVAWKVDHLWPERVVKRVEMERGKLTRPGRPLVVVRLPLLLLLLVLLLLLLLALTSFSMTKSAVF